MVGVSLETCTQNLLVVVEVDAVAIEHEVVDVGNTNHVQLQTTRLHEELLLGTNLLEQHATYSTDTADEDVEHLIF